MIIMEWLVNLYNLNVIYDKHFVELPKVINYNYISFVLCLKILKNTKNK